MNITLTRSELTTLLEMVSLGNWLINSYRPANELLANYEDAEQILLRQAYKVGLRDVVMYDKNLARFFPTNKMEDTLQPFIDAYDDDNFWTLLITRLAQRDIIAEAGGIEAYVSLDREERFKQLLEREAHYEQLACDVGLAALKFVESNAKDDSLLETDMPK